MNESYEMFFNTGVKTYNRLSKDGQFKLGKWEVLKDGTIQIKYYLEEKPKNNYKFQFLAPANYLKNLKSFEVAIKIVDGGMLSDYAIFII